MTLDRGQAGDLVQRGRHVVPCDQDERSLRELGAGAPDKVESVDFRHVVIAHDHLRIKLGDRSEGVGGAVVDANFAIEILLKQLRYEIRVRLFVIDDNNSFLRGGIHRRYSKREHRIRERQPVRRLHPAFLAVRFDA